MQAGRLVQVPPDMAFDPRVFIGRVRWVFAKTMAHYNPHEYVVESVEGGPQFDGFVALINQGHVRLFAIKTPRESRSQAAILRRQQEIVTQREAEQLSWVEIARLHRTSEGVVRRSYWKYVQEVGPIIAREQPAEPAYRSDGGPCGSLRITSPSTALSTNCSTPRALGWTAACES
jgi:hypothetical protein